MTQTTMSSMTMRASARASGAMRATRATRRANASRGRGRATVTRAGEVQKMNAEELEIAMANRETPMVIDFYATWCGPCVLMSSELEKVQEQLGTRCAKRQGGHGRGDGSGDAVADSRFTDARVRVRGSVQAGASHGGMLPAETVVSVIENEL